MENLLNFCNLLLHLHTKMVIPLILPKPVKCCTSIFTSSEGSISDHDLLSFHLSLYVMIRKAISSSSSWSLLPPSLNSFPDHSLSLPVLTLLWTKPVQLYTIFHTWLLCPAANCDLPNPSLRLIPPLAAFTPIHMLLNVAGENHETLLTEPTTNLRYMILNGVSLILTSAK